MTTATERLKELKKERNAKEEEEEEEEEEEKKLGEIKNKIREFLLELPSHSEGIVQITEDNREIKAFRFLNRKTNQEYLCILYGKDQSITSSPSNKTSINGYDKIIEAFVDQESDLHKEQLTDFYNIINSEMSVIKLIEKYDDDNVKKVCDEIVLS